MKRKHIAWIVIAGVVLILFMMIGRVIGWKNRLVEVDENTKKAWAQVESQLQRRLNGITQKMLTQQLRELERDGLVIPWRSFPFWRSIIGDLFVVSNWRRDFGSRRRFCGRRGCGS